MELAFGDGALAEEAGRDLGPALHMVGERQAGGDRQPAADDGVASVEAGGGVEDVHRAAAALTRPLDLAEHLRHHRARGDAPGQSVAVLAVGGDDGVVRGRGPA